jgi:hemolysin III
MYLASTAYHAVPVGRARTKQKLRTLDHCSIFVLIAGTYTAFTLTVLRGWGSYALLVAMWSLCAGAIYRACRRRSGAGGPVRQALAMGWLVIAVAPELARTLAPPALVLLVAGGLVYTLGVPFYVWRRLPHHHGIWHAFVLLGSLNHFVAIAHFALPGAP